MAETRHAISTQGRVPDHQRRAADLKCRLQQEDFKKEIGIKNGGPRYVLQTNKM
jgi:hypothetical protein